MKFFTVVSYNKELRGLIHEGISEIKPIIIIIHGYFTSNKIGPNRLYYQLAEELKKNGYTVVRCDLRGMGESEGDIKEINFHDHVEDVNKIIDYVSKKYQRKIIVIGHSFGCLTVIENILSCPDKFHKVVFISPIHSSQKTLSAFFTDNNTILALINNGYTYRKGLYVSYSFFNEDLSLNSVSLKFRNICIPTTVLIGDNDQFLEIEEFLEFCVNSNLKPIIVKDGDHNFLDETARKSLFNEIQNFLQSEDKINE